MSITVQYLVGVLWQRFFLLSCQLDLPTGDQVYQSCTCTPYNWCIRPHVALHHPTSPTCASRTPPCQHDNRSALLLVVTSWCQKRESSSAIGHSRSPVQKRGTACQSTSGHLTPSLPSRTVSKHICLNCRTASSSDVFDVDRRPCSDSRHVTAPYKLALYYYYYYSCGGFKVRVHFFAISFCWASVSRTILIYHFCSSVCLSVHLSVCLYCVVNTLAFLNPTAVTKFRG